MSDLGTPYRVLVVDDQPPNVLLAETLLKAQGYVVDTANDGPKALIAVERQPPDLVLLDVMMPGMDGLSVTRQLKSQRDTRHIPIVLLTTLQATEDRIRGIDAGADDFISKPFNRHELLARVRSLVKMKRLVEAERNHLRRTLERYVDSAIAQMLLDDPTMAAPGGQRREATVLFADIRGFSGWADVESPETVVEVLNRFLGAAVDVIFRHGGTIDKFTGDGLMALFGAPLAQPDHARRAVAAALELQRVANDVAHPTLARALQIGCGVHTGEMVVGNIGSDRRLDYTAIGAAVNLAKRLEEIAEGGHVIVASGTLAQLAGAETVEIGRRHLKGLPEPIAVYRVDAIP